MSYFPVSEDALVVRTDFSDEAAWQALCEAIRQPVGEFQASVHCVSDPRFSGLSVEGIVDRAGEHIQHSFLFIVDKTALSDADNPVLVLDLTVLPYKSFRVIPTEMWAVENNLSLGNMDFSDFADYADEDGVFRGFPK